MKGGLHSVCKFWLIVQRSRLLYTDPIWVKPEQLVSSIASLLANAASGPTVIYMGAILLNFFLPCVILL